MSKKKAKAIYKCPWPHCRNENFEFEYSEECPTIKCPRCGNYFNHELEESQTKKLSMSRNQRERKKKGYTK